MPSDKIVYQGVEGSFGHLTAIKLFGDSCQLKGMPSFKETFEAVEKGLADKALLPIENALAGAIYETIDLLSQGSLYIIGVTKTRIELSLLALPGSEVSGIQKVLSHPKALQQCVQFFAKHPKIEGIPYYNTAGAAADIAKENNPSTAAIASPMAAKLYGLIPLEQGIQDHQENFTRFLLLSKKPSTGDRCSLCFTLEHRKGSLAEILSLLADQGANLTYIISRPLVGRPFEYLFYLDLEIDHPLDLQLLTQKTTSLKCLGAYHELGSFST